MSRRIDLRWMRVISVVLILSGCATRPVIDDSLAEFHGELPARAWLRENTAVLNFSAERGREVYAVADWQHEHTPVQNYTHSFGRLEYIDNDWPEGLPDQKEFTEIPVLPASQWTELLTLLTEQLVPSAPLQGLLLLVQNQALVAYRDESGKMITVPNSQLPAGVEIVNSCDQTAFLERAADILDDYASRLNLPDRKFLFQPETGGRPGVRFVLVDLDGRYLISLNSAQPTEVVDELGLVGFSTRGATSILLRSHVIAFLKNPLTSMARLVNFALTTTYNFIYFQDRSIARELPEVGLEDPMDMELWERDLDRMVSSPAYPGKLDFLIDGERFFSVLLNDLVGAASSIDMRVYIFDRDDYAVKIADLLKDRSNGVEVRVLMDDLGSLFAGNFPPATPMEPGFQAPASIVDYLKADSLVKVRRSSNPWFTADHTKNIIIDDRVAYTGGMNIGREYRFEWHDMMVRLEGPIVTRIGRDFAKAWAHAGIGGDLAYAWRSTFEKRPDSDQSDNGSIAVRPIYTKTARREILKAQVEAIRRSRNHVFIQNAYLSDDSILNALIDARRRGVDVRVVLPSGNDSGIMAASNVITANVLLNNGIRVYAYPGMTHIKAGIFDGWASVGSANYDKLSFYINQEMNIGFSDPETVDRLRQELFIKDFAASRELDEVIVAGWSDYLYEFLADQL